MTNLAPAPTTLSVLMIDDDQELVAMVAELLAREGILAQGAPTAAAGMAALRARAPDVLVLDLMLPDANGLDVCRRLRQAGDDTPILMLTARGDPLDRVLGLEIGADDYLGKPFEPRELAARIRALARRRQDKPLRTRLDFDGMRIDLFARRVVCGNVVLQLTSIEFKLLATLAAAAGVIVERHALSTAIQPGNYVPQDRAVDVQVARLRKKLLPQPDGAEWIDTVRGEGYVFIGRPV
jgi:two-component system phosphate regulon response regulator OmpR